MTKTNNSTTEYNLEVFISGQNTDLCIPSEDFAKFSTWHKWFNNPRTTKFLEQGIFPNTVKKQEIFFQELARSDDRISFIISDKINYIGTVSLSFINLYKRTADVALLIGEKSASKNSDLIALEAMSLITEYGFNRLGLKRISGGQHEKLILWQRKLELIGYKVEGYKIKSFIKGAEEANAFIISSLKEDFLRIVSSRGHLWDNNDNMRRRIQQMPKIAFASKLKKFFNEESENYYDMVFKL